MKIKKTNKLLLYIFIFLIFTAFVLFFLRLAYADSAIKTLAGNDAEKNVTVILDAGHGGEDGGAESESGILEKDINLQIVLKLQKILKSAGFNVKTVREDDISVCNEGLETVRERKVSDIKNRTELFNSDENNIVISIHQNKFTESKYHGTQIFYSVNNPESSKLAEYIKNSVVSLLQPDNERECKKADENIYILHNAQVPAIIVECGFLSNYEEAEKLADLEYQQQLAFSIYLGFLEYYNNKDV